MTEFNTADDSMFPGVVTLASDSMVELEIRPTAAARMRVSGVIVLASFIIAVFVFLLTGGGKNLFESKTTLTTYMPDVTGLSEKAEVRLSGIPIGSVRKIEFSGELDPQRAIRVQAQVSSRFLKSIPQDSETSITADTLVGWDFVSIAEGKSAIPVSENGVLRSEPVRQASDRADLMRTTQTELRRIDELLVQISSGGTPVGQFVMGEQVYDDLLAKVSSFESAVHAFVGPRSQIGQGLFSMTLYDKVRKPLLQLDTLLAGIQRGEGAGGKMFADDAQYLTFVRTLRDLHNALADMNQGKGPMGQMLTDPAAYENAAKLLRQTDAMLASLNAGEGPIGNYLRDPRVYESLNGSLRNLQAFLADFRENPKKYLRYKVF